MLQYILIPCFQNAFDCGKGEDLIGGPAAPDQDNADNVISVFINKVGNSNDVPTIHSHQSKVCLQKFNVLQCFVVTGHVNVQSCLLIIFQYQPISLQDS